MRGAFIFFCAFFCVAQGLNTLYRVSTWDGVIRQGEQLCDIETQKECLVVNYELYKELCIVRVTGWKSYEFMSITGVTRESCYLKFQKTNAGNLLTLAGYQKLLKWYCGDYFVIKKMPSTWTEVEHVVLWGVLENGQLCEQRALVLSAAQQFSF